MPVASESLEVRASRRASDGMLGESLIIPCELQTPLLRERARDPLIQHSVVNVEGGEYPGRCYASLEVYAIECRDLRVGVGVVRRVRLSEVSKRPNYRSQLQNLVSGWGDNNNNDAGLLRVLMVT